VRVNVAGVNAALGQNVDPDVFQHQLAPVEIKFQILGKGGDVFVERIDNRLKDRKPPRQIGERCIGRIARIIICLTPFIAGIVIFGDGVARGP
jgi:hypothetical protein